MSSQSSLVTPEHLKQFDQQGYFVLPAVIPPEHVAMMTEVVKRAVSKRDEYVKTIINNQNTKEDGTFLEYSGDGKYFFSLYEDYEPDINKIIFSSYMEEITKAVLGDTVYYTHSHVVVKRGEGDKDIAARTAFAWHQDSGYVPYQHIPYMSCWCALTEMTTTSGTITVLPADRYPSPDENHKVNWYAKPRPAATTEFPCYQHWKDDKSSDLVGYFGSDQGVEVLCPVGSIVVFSSLTLHRSAPNRGNAFRSAFLGQYAPAPLMSEDQQSFRHKADPFIIKSETNPELRKWQE